MLKENMLAHNHSMLQPGLTTFGDTITRTIYDWSKFIFNCTHMNVQWSFKEPIDGNTTSIVA